jgi:hypothetical protein
MTQSASFPDGSDPLTRREFWRLVAAALGVPLVAPLALASSGQPTPVDPEAVLTANETAPPAEDHPVARAMTVHNLKFIGWAMHNFTAKNGGRLPPAAIGKEGKALLSWRVAILPFLEELSLYQKFHLDEPWNGPHNQALLKEMPQVYAPVVPKGQAPYATYYQGIVGPGSLFEGQEGTKIAEVIDAARPTLMVLEAGDPVPWTKPEDVRYDGAGRLPKLGGQFEDGFYVAFADGSTRFLGREIAPEQLRALITQRRGQGS